jgi:hypothetical protein
LCPRRRVGHSLLVLLLLLLMLLTSDVHPSLAYPQPPLPPLLPAVLQWQWLLLLHRVPLQPWWSTTTPPPPAIGLQSLR